MSNLTYEEIFGRLVKASYQGKLQEEIDSLESSGDEHTRQYVQYALGKGDPDRVVFQVKSCNKRCSEDDHSCEASCLFNAVVRNTEGNVVIQDRNCTHCGECIETCSLDSLVDKKEFIPLVEILQSKEIPVFAMVAPAIIGQFGGDVTMGQLRAALKHLGFYGMIEVALFADVLSLKEALEFDKHVQTDKDFVLTSCCCPIWVGMVKRVYDTLVPHISPSVSPMVACGRGIKRLHPDAKTVFIGPCIAKKAEAKEPDIRDAVDAVLTFHELKQIFEATDIEPLEMEDIPSEHSSTSGRIYARTGGVSKSISDTLNRIRPDKPVKIKSIQANGVKECKALLNDIMNNEIKANFYEGMGCPGGCVGGPKAIVDVDKGTEFVNKYGAEADALTPADNQHVLELLKQLGIDSVEELLGGESAAIFQRDF